MRCWYSRWQLSNALDRGALAGALARGHAATCTRCQAYASSLKALHARLLDSAVLAPEPAAAAPVARPRRRLIWLAPLAAAGAAAVALTLAVRSPADEPTAPVVAAPAPQIDNARSLATRVTRALTAERTSLDTELDALVHEGRRGLDAALLGLGSSLRRTP